MERQTERKNGRRETTQIYRMKELGKDRQNERKKRRQNERNIKKARTTERETDRKND